MESDLPFMSRIRPALRSGGYREEHYWVWCGSVIRGEDGRYHMFAVRWPREYPFFQGYLAASEVVRASSEKPEGPYVFEEVVLPERGEEFWDGRMTHNPFITKWHDEYLLFYIGATYKGARPDIDTMREYAADPKGAGRYFEWYPTIRIGMARADSVYGPWRRSDVPALDANPDSWDNGVVTNPAVCIAPDDTIMLYYRGRGTRLGLAVASSPGEPFIRPVDHPIVALGNPVEDPFVFRNDGIYHMLCKDLSGKIIGEFHGGIHLLSQNGIEWQLSPHPKAWSRKIMWDDGTETIQANIERPFVLFEENRPSYLFAATADGPGPRDGKPGFCFAESTWNMVFPLC